MNLSHLTRHFSPRSFNRFIMVGIVNTAFSVGVFPLFFYLTHNYLPLNAIVSIFYVITTLFSFMTHKFLTFQKVGFDTKEGIKYYILCGINYMLNMILLNLTIPLFPNHPIILQTTIAICLQIGNFLGMKRFIFRLTEPKKP